MYVLFDTQTAVIDLKAAGFEEQQAQAIVTVIKNAQVELVTKRDLVDLEHRLIIKLGALIVVAFGIFTSLLAYIIR
jgi:squalene cyclase